MSTLGPKHPQNTPSGSPYYWFPEQRQPSLCFTRYSLFQDQTPQSTEVSYHLEEQRLSAFFVTASFKGMRTIDFPGLWCPREALESPLLQFYFQRSVSQGTSDASQRPSRKPSAALR